MHAVHFSQLLSAPFLAPLEMQIFVNNPRNWWSMDPPPYVKFLWLFGGSEVCLPDSATATQLCWRFHQYAQLRTASAAARMPVDCSELHQQTVDAVLCPTFVQKLCYKLPSIVIFTFIQIFDQNFVFFTERRQSWHVWCSLKQCQNSRYFRCLTKSW